MDSILRDHGHHLLKTLRARLPKVPAVSARLRIPRWGWVVPAAFGLALYAHRGSRDEGRIEWLRENAPSPAAWQSACARPGFRRVEDPAWKEKAYAEMPELSRRSDSALLSENHRTLALRLNGEWIYYQLGGTSNGKAAGEVVKRELWEGLGTGWEAIAALDRIVFPKTRTTDGPALPKNSGDPRMLRY